MSRDGLAWMDPSLLPSWHLMASRVHDLKGRETKHVEPRGISGPSLHLRDLMTFASGPLASSLVCAGLPQPYIQAAAAIQNLLTQTVHPNHTTASAFYYRIVVYDSECSIL